MDEMVFESLEPIEVPVKIDGQAYVLCEATGEGAIQYTNGKQACMQWSDGNVTGVNGIANLWPQLLYHCLFKVGEDGKRSKLSQTAIRQWPHRIQKPLFDRAVEISELEADNTVEDLIRQRDKLTEQIEKLQALETPPKNEPESTEDG